MALATLKKVRKKFEATGRILTGRERAYDEEILARSYKMAPFAMLENAERNGTLSAPREVKLETATASLPEKEGWSVEVTTGWANRQLMDGVSDDSNNTDVTVKPDFTITVKDKKGNPVAAMIIGDSQVVELATEEGAGLNRDVPKWLTSRHFLGCNKDGDYLEMDPDSKVYRVQQNARYFTAAHATALSVITKILEATYPDRYAKPALSTVAKEPAPPQRDMTKTSVIIEILGENAPNLEGGS